MRLLYRLFDHQLFITEQTGDGRSMKPHTLSRLTVSLTSLLHRVLGSRTLVSFCSPCASSTIHTASIPYCSCPQIDHSPWQMNGYIFLALHSLHPVHHHHFSHSSPHFTCSYLTPGEAHFTLLKHQFKMHTTGLHPSPLMQM